MIPKFISKGGAKKINLNLWDGFHKSLLSTAKAMIKADKANEVPAEKDVAKVENLSYFKKLAPMLPLFVCNVKSKMDMDVKTADIEKMMGLP